MHSSLRVFILLVSAVSAFAQWVQQNSNTTWPLYGVSASNPHTATAVDVSTILRTTDAGQTWVPQTGDPGQVFNAVSFCDDSNGTIGGPNGLTVYTHNAGQSWQTAQVGGIVGYYAAYQLSPQWAIVGGADMNGVVIVSVTTDGWQTFSGHTFFPNHNGNYYTGGIFGIHFITTEIGFAAIAVDNGEGAICRTTDSGVTWETVHWNSSPLYAIDFPISDASQIGYAVGANGTVVRTTDGGSTWQSQPTPTTQQLNGVSFPTMQVGWAVGDGGTIIRTQDGGQSWQMQVSPVDVNLHAVSFANADTGYAVGNNGYIIFTANGGAPPNRAPGEFWRVHPEDGDSLDCFNLIHYAWTRSIDPDGDVVTYTVRAWSPVGDWSDSVITTDTTWISACCFDTIRWTVHSTDGQDTVMASNGTGEFYRFWGQTAHDPGSALPRDFALSAYPNPFNPTTTLHLSLPVSSEAVLRVFDVTGRLVKETRLGMLTSGSHEIAFNGPDLPSGIYIAAVETPTARKTQKLVLLK